MGGIGIRVYGTWFKHIYFIFVIYIVFEIIQSEKDRNGSKMLMKFFSCKI